MTAKRVFILGAGFSHHTGIALMNSLLLEILDYARGSSHFYNDDLTMIEEAIAFVYPGSARDENDWNIEDFLTVCEVLKESYESIDETAAFRFGESILLTLHAMVEYMWRKIDSADLTMVSKLLLTLGHDTVISFNWDTLIEKTAQDMSRSYQYLDNAPNADSFLLLKLHGSINWIEFTDTRPHHPELFGKIFGNLHFYKGPEKIDYFMPLRRPPAILPPTLWKTHHLLRPLWDKALSELQIAEEILIVGYSFPYFDFYSRALMRMALMVSELAPTKRVIRIIDPSREVLTGFEKHIAMDSSNLGIVFEERRFEDCSLMQ